MFCGKCGVKIEIEGGFCDQCGARLETPHQEKPRQNLERVESFEYNDYRKEFGQGVHDDFLALEGEKKKKQKPLMIIMGVLLLVAVVVAGWLFLGFQNTRAFNDSMDQAHRYLLIENLEQAQAHFLRAIEINPREAEPYLRLAEIYMELDEPEEAVAVLEQGLEAVPEEDRPALEEILNEIYEIIGRRPPATEEVADEPESDDGESSDDIGESEPDIELEIVPMIASAWNYSLALDSNGSVWSWGMDLYYSDFHVYNNIPVQIEELNDIVAIDAGERYVLALERDGTLWTWDVYVRSPEERTTPVKMEGLDNVVAIAASSFCLVIDDEGSVWSWGGNYGGTLGDGTTVSRDTPERIQGLSNITAVALGSFHVLALDADGNVWTWGSNWNGQLGNGTTTHSYVPIRVENLSNITAIAAGDGHSLAVDSDGNVWGWGHKGTAQSGGIAFTAISSKVPVLLEGLRDIALIRSESIFSHALDRHGNVWAWGIIWQANYSSPSSSSDPVQVENLSNVIAIANPDTSSLALDSDGYVWAWGWNNTGQLGIGSSKEYSAIPIRVLGPDGIGYLNLFVN